MKLNKLQSVYQKTLQGNLTNEADELNNFLVVENNQKKNQVTYINKGTGVDTRDFHKTRESKEKETITKLLESHTTNTNPFTSLAFIPKRKIKFTPHDLLSYSNNPKAFGKRRFNELSVDASSNNCTNRNTVIINQTHKPSQIPSFNPMQNILNNNLENNLSISENEYLTFKTNYILKFARNKEVYQKMTNYLNKISDDNKKLIIEFYRKLVLISEKKERILFDSMNFNVMNSNGHSDVNLNYQNWKECAVLFYELESYWLKLSDIVLKEMCAVKDANVHLEKKASDQNHLLINKDKSIKQMQEFIDDHDINPKSSKMVKKMKELDQMKEEFGKKENMNVYNVFRLEEEIKDLTSLLDKDKEYYNKYLESLEMLETKKKEIDEIRAKFNVDVEDKKLKIAYLNNEKQELNSVIKHLESELTNLQDMFDNSKKEYIEFYTQIKILKQTVDARNENIEMLTEECDAWRCDYEREVKEHKNTKEFVHSLEVKILSLKKERKISNMLFT